jgi:Transcriptional regulator
MSDNLSIEEWLRMIDKYYGFNKMQQSMGRPQRSINEDLLMLMHAEGHSNREISRQLCIPRRTIDRRMHKLSNEGKLNYEPHKNRFR